MSQTEARSRVFVATLNSNRDHATAITAKRRWAILDPAGRYPNSTGAWPDERSPVTPRGTISRDVRLCTVSSR